MLRRAQIVAVAAGLACSSGPTEPDGPTIVPAGAADVAWANIGKSCTPSARVATVPAMKRDSLPQYTHGPTRSVDDDWADAARQIPGGWGGVFLDNGVPTMFLVDTLERSAAIASMTNLGMFTTLNLSQARAKAGRWDFVQLADWYRYLSIHVWFVQGMRSADIQEVQNRIEFGVADQATRLSLENRLIAMDLPCYLVAIEVPGS